MSDTKFVNIKFNITNHNLELKEYAVLSYLSALSSKRYVFASNAHIAETLNLNQRTLYRILNKLESKNLIKRETKSTGRYGKDRKIYVHPTVISAYHTE